MQVKDPVCGMMVEDTTAPKSTYKGTTYYFCNEQCKTTFDADPARYTTAVATART